MTTTPAKINENERKVLEVLAEEWDEMAYYFRAIVKHTGLDLKQVRRACRSLAKKGYAEYRRGLFNEDGMAAGSGYSATREGALLVRGCIGCKIRIATMENGQCQTCWEIVETRERIKAMESMGIPTTHLGWANVSLCDLDILRKHYEQNGIPAKLRPAGALAQVNRLVKQYGRHYKI